MSIIDKIRSIFPASSASFDFTAERVIMAAEEAKKASEDSKEDTAQAVELIKRSNEEISCIAQNTDIMNSIADSIRALSSSIEEINTRLCSLEASVTQTYSKLNADISAVQEIIEHNAETEQQICGLISENSERQISELCSKAEMLSSLKDRIERLDRKIDHTTNRVNLANREAKETVWANIFHDTVTASAWYTDRVISPGRWALGYQALYVLYSSLEIAKPQSILELGLGQSTRMISQYAAYYPQTKHYVVERDDSWIEFFMKENKLPANTEIVHLEYAMETYKDAQVRVFNGFAERFRGERFDCIVVDAPWGKDMKQYARIDILSIIPDSLCEDFVIVVDDTNRPGETNTVAEIGALLTNNNISFKTGKYLGNKECTIICSESLGFLSTL